RFGRACDQGLYDSMFEMTPHARARGAIMNSMLEITPRVRARDAITSTVRKITPRVRVLNESKGPGPFDSLHLSRNP
ncbi:MAG: hypothetical protein J6S36_04755, partial [Eggerthellaceae bacterium]|nr:hypothetical protein [Eggerthellaceae bacterium]